MDSLFDGTSRLAQFALVVFAVGAFMTVGSAAYQGSAKLGPIIMIIAGGMAVGAYMKDREDYGMWPAYATFGAVIVGVVVSIPLMMNTSGMRTIAEHGQTARDSFDAKRTAIAAAATTCVVDGPYQNCTAKSIADTVEARQVGVVQGRDCREGGRICISDDGPNGYRLEYLSESLESVGILRIDEKRTFRHQVLSSTCRGIDPKIDQDKVKAACGPDAVVVASESE